MIGRTQGSALEEERNFPQKLSLTGQAAPAPAPLREFGFPPCIQAPFSAFDSDQVLKQHGRYKAAKSGDSDAAIALVYALAVPLFRQFSNAVERGNIPADHIVVAPHAREATGDNAIPQVLAALFSICGGDLDDEIVQTTKVYHTGADPMERLNARASFHGRIERGRHYVLVDDVTTLGGTLCDLADFIQRGGGIPVAAIVLVNASRSGRLQADPKTIAILDKRGLGNEIRKIFNILPRALTADEAQYLVGFRSVEEIRGRSAKARQKTDLRLRAKGVRIDEAVEQPRLMPSPGRRSTRRLASRSYYSIRWIRRR
ncbi:phosphoribosyltransferase [Paraburkholderia bannensis]|uniref:phosphoribosyltransferase n=1 Tax=Paraburkholderia bannensis TaxID=765414 RepID=UPI0012EC5E88|nr:phosphoribosyltransferase [Paraburkholderia bannensis]